MGDSGPSSILVCQSLKGREYPPEGNHKISHQKNRIDTPTLPFETEGIKVHRPNIPKRTPSYSKIRPKSGRKDDGMYAVRFSDYTWAHSDPDAKDHYASRKEIQEIAEQYDRTIDTITGFDDIEQINSLQAATDLLLDQIINQLRAENRQQSELIERARYSYAQIFKKLESESDQCRKEIEKLNATNASLESNLSKVISSASDRIREAKEDYDKQISEYKQEVNEKKDEYDTSMKRFLEQKVQLEEHVKALHRVFQVFQNDTVYTTLEDLKQKQSSLKKKLQNRDNEILKLNNHISNLQKRLQEIEEGKSIVEKSNEELQQKLQLSVRTEQEEEKSKEKASDDTTFSENADQTTKTDPSQYLHINQKLSKITDLLTDFLQNNNSKEFLIKSKDETEIDQLLISCDSKKMLHALDVKVDEIIKLIESLDSTTKNKQEPTQKQVNLQPRIIQLIGPITNNNKDKKEINQNAITNFHKTIRQLYTYKYLSDQWHHRMGKTLIRFPEFLVSYYYQENKGMFRCIQKCKRIIHIIETDEKPETKLFKKFLYEKFTVDELSFFLEMRTFLINDYENETQQVINLPIGTCQEFIAKILGSKTPITKTLYEELKNFEVNEKIDFSQFSLILLKYYRNERIKRRNAIRLLFQSKKLIKDKNSNVDFECFVSIIQSLGFNGSLDEIFELHRNAIDFSKGNGITIESMLAAMDNLSFHFYTIELPFQLTKQIENISVEQALRGIPVTSSNPKHIDSLNLTEEQIQNTESILEDLISEEPERSILGLKDLRNQVSILKTKIIGFLGPLHINRLFFLLQNVQYQDDVLTILAQTANPEYSELLLANQCPPMLIHFLNTDNLRYRTIALLIIGNNCQHSKIFRDCMFETQVLKSVSLCQPYDIKEKIWALICSLEKAPYPNGYEQFITETLVQYSIEPNYNRYINDNTQTINLRKMIIKGFNTMLINGCNEFIQYLINNNYIFILAESLLNSSTKHYINIINLLSECCIDDIAKSQMITNDILTMIRDIISNNLYANDLISSCFTFISNWIDLTNDYIPQLSDILCTKIDFVTLYNISSFMLQQKITRTLERIVFVILPEHIPIVISKELVGILGNLMLSCELNLNVFIVSIFVNVFAKCREMTEFLSELAEELQQYVMCEYYEEVMEMDESFKAQQLFDNVREYIGTEEEM
ncbi:hypothetical protein GPJ56_003720 [Histomonas meleagridis]|uniref:uncharacterized protein n=1 Tax=Histomonas meleagridis TaxID=135588 RepID=UPI003559C5B0|nr:hypothetical protein GPJ56_003720 [Histomonas meleagridis]KAH0800562.1 hypothetical protein GO595_006630 [Histomonas meleagridis]